MIDFQPVDLSPEGLVRASELLRVVFPEAPYVTPDYLHRLYFGNPLGETFGFCVHGENDRLVGLIINIPIKARVNGREEVGIWPFQLATHPQARLKGLFAGLWMRGREECQRRGYGFLAGVGNQNSTPILTGHFDCQGVRQLDAKLGFGTPPPGRELPDAQLVRVWDSPELVAWRLQHHHDTPYRVRWRGDVGHLYAPTGRLGIQAEVGAFPREMLPGDLRPLRSPQPLRLWIGADPTRDWSRSGWFDVPARLRPSPLTLLWYDLTGQGRRLDPARVQYGLMDFDAY